jgi:adenylate cyclase
MAREIERKFLVKGDAWKAQAFAKKHYAQGYLNDIHQPGNKSSIRVRIEDDQGRLNIKSLEIGLSRDEYEYPIPLEDAEKMLRTLTVGPVIEKNRYFIKVGNHTWEVDEFLGDNAGLIVAEVEMETEEDDIEMPEWVGKEVTHLPRYYNVSLSQNPYSTWDDKDK